MTDCNSCGGCGGCQSHVLLLTEPELRLLRQRTRQHNLLPFAAG